MTTETRSPHITHAGAGEPRWWFGALAEILLTHDQTAGAVSIVQVTEAPGAEAPSTSTATTTRRSSSSTAP